MDVDKQTVLRYATAFALSICIATGLDCYERKVLRYRSQYAQEHIWDIWGASWSDFLELSILWASPIALIACFVGLMSSRYLFVRRTDKETRCRKCGYILRGLSAPKCPECGEHI